MKAAKPLTEEETTQILVLLRKLWRESATDRQIASIAKSLFALITRKLYEEEEIAKS